MVSCVSELHGTATVSLTPTLQVSLNKAPAQLLFPGLVTAWPTGHRTDICARIYPTLAFCKFPIPSQNCILTVFNAKLPFTDQKLKEYLTSSRRLYCDSSCTEHTCYSRTKIVHLTFVQWLENSHTRTCRIRWKPRIFGAHVGNRGERTVCFQVHLFLTLCSWTLHWPLCKQ